MGRIPLPADAQAIIGTLSATLGTLTVASTAQVVITGSEASTLDALTLASTAQLPIAGSLSSTLGALTLASTAQLPIAGTLGATLGALTLVSAATVGDAVAASKRRPMAYRVKSGTDELLKTLHRINTQAADSGALTATPAPSPAAQNHRPTRPEPDRSQTGARPEPVVSLAELTALRQALQDAKAAILAAQAQRATAEAERIAETARQMQMAVDAYIAADEADVELLLLAA